MGPKAQTSRDAQATAQLKSEKMREEFRHLCMLLIFATAYNMDGLPLLLDKSYNHEWKEDPDAYHRVTPARVLDALGTAFVRNDEIIATAEFFPDVLITLQVRETISIQQIP